MRDMNIVMATNNYLPHIGGVARSVVSFTEEYRSRGHRVLVVAPQLKGQPADPDLITIPSVHLNKTRDLGVPLPVTGAVTLALSDFRPDIVHAHHPFMLGDTALLTAARWNIPLVFTYHTMYEHYTHYAVDASPKLKKFMVDLSIGYANLCDCVFAPSPSVAAILKERGVTTPIEVVPTGINVRRFAQGNGAAVRKKLHIPPSAFVVGHVGRLAEEKNLRFLMDALLLFLKSDSRAHALIVGDGPLREELQAQARKSPAGSRVHFLGALENEALVNAYHAMNVFVFSSVTETQGLVLLEALAAGVPVLAIDAAGSRDIIAPGKNGWLVPAAPLRPFAAALRMASQLSPARQARLRRACQKTAAKYTETLCAQRALSIYQRLCASHKEIKYSEQRLQKSSWAAAHRLVTTEWSLWANRLSAIYSAWEHV